MSQNKGRGYVARCFLCDWTGHAATEERIRAITHAHTCAGIEALGSGKEHGMRQALDNAATEWKADFRRTVKRLAATRKPFTSEDVTAEVGLPRGSVASNRNNAVGAMMNALAKSQVIVKTGRHVKSRSPRSNGAELIEWVGP